MTARISMGRFSAVLLGLAAPLMFAAGTGAAQTAPASDTDSEAPEAVQSPVVPAPSPIVVAFLPTGRIPAATLSTIRSAVDDNARTRARGRPVQDLTDAARIGRCRDALCVGALITEANAVAGLIAKVKKAGRGFELSIELVDPVSGSRRGEVSRGPVTADASASVRTIFERVASAFPEPPPPPPAVLIAVNVDGAEVQIDGRAVGTTPIAPITLAPGRHMISVAHPDYEGSSRSVQIGDQGTTRVDIELEPARNRRSQLETPYAPYAGMFGKSGGTLSDDDTGGTTNTSSAVEFGQQSDRRADDDGSQPLFERWYVWVGAGVIVAGLVTIFAIAFAPQSGGTLPAMGVPLPAITI